MTTQPTPPSSRSLHDAANRKGNEPLPMLG